MVEWRALASGRIKLDASGEEDQNFDAGTTHQLALGLEREERWERDEHTTGACQGKVPQLPHLPQPRETCHYYHSQS